MNTVLASHVDEHRTFDVSSRAIWSLGLREGRRMLLSPAVLLIVGWAVLMTGIDAAVNLSTASLPTRGELYEGLSWLFALYAGLVFYIACHLVASSARRTKAEGQFSASPMSPRMRSAALCVGVLVGPGLLAAAVMVVLALLGGSMSVAELAQIALTVVGGGMFAVMCATWLRFPGSLPLGLVVLVFGTILMSDAGRAPINTWPWFAPYITAPDWSDEVWALMGSQAWHAVYLAGLCALAFCAVMLREREGRLRWLAISAGVLAATAAAGALQV
jgi:hypothetical protein